MRINRIFLLSISIFIGITSIAQQQEFMNEDMKKIAKENSNERWIHFKQDFKSNPITLFTNYSQAFNLSADDEMRMTSQEQDDLEFKHFLFHQYYKGLRVYGANYLVHENAEGNIYSVNGDIANNLNLDISSTVSETTALNYLFSNFI